MNNNPVTVAQILGALKRHKFKAAFAWLFVMAAVVVGFLIWPRTYGSEGKLYIQVGRNQTNITPANGSSAVTVQDTRETEIRSVVELIKSRAVLEAVIQEIGAKEILASRWDDLIPKISLPNLSASQGGDGLTVDQYNQLKEQEVAAKFLEQNMVVHAEKKTSVISVYAKASSAKLAQRIVDRVFHHTQEVHKKIHESEGSAIFFGDQFAIQEKTLVKATKELADYRNKKKVLSISAARASLQSILSTLESDIINSEVGLSQSAERVEGLTKMMENMDRQLAVPRTGVERLSFEDSQTELFKLMSERDGLSEKLQPGHPELVQIEKRIERVQKSLDAMKSERTESEMVSNPVFEAMEVDLLRAKADKLAAEARLSSLKEKQESAIAKLADLNQSEIEVDQLQRNIDIARQYLNIYTAKRGEAMSMSRFDDRDISDIKVAQDANFVVKHVSPKGSLIIPLGFFAGLLAALATAMFCERNHLSSTLNEGDVEQVLELPVLVTLPRVYSSRNMVN